MAKRNLTEEEKKICNKQLIRLNYEVEYCQYLTEYNKLMMDKGLKMNYEKELKRFKDNEEQNEADLSLAKEKIRILTDQLRNGVTVKEPQTQSETTKEG